MSAWSWFKRRVLGLQNPDGLDPEGTGTSIRTLPVSREIAAQQAEMSNWRSCPSPNEFRTGKQDHHPWVSGPGITVVDEEGNPLEADDPLNRAIQKSFETGEEVIWNEGEPLP